ncbi:hypothetical protein Bphy_2285 [Paraburkholderia phymatum STM815]|uniref:Uncharacterized protein n=1 Tax=Paraburkholderia phymatum (strain DSM 17167 / CIP 108236 / LMG 21445 / STM815) TaxID=391038 RepID=B2JF92_PARP8|nr:hypothetical protein Bphy_2285 [Paraburkholderia phymatum STM815]
MKSHIIGRYRGFIIEARTQQRISRSSDALTATCHVTWHVRGLRPVKGVMGMFADPAAYPTESIAISSADRSARAFIDAMLDRDRDDRPSAVPPT